MARAMESASFNNERLLAHQNHPEMKRAQGGNNSVRQLRRSRRLAENQSSQEVGLPENSDRSSELGNDATEGSVQDDGRKQNPVISEDNNSQSQIPVTPENRIIKNDGQKQNPAISEENNSQSQRPVTPENCIIKNSHHTGFQLSYNAGEENKNIDISSCQLSEELTLGQVTAEPKPATKKWHKLVTYHMRNQLVQEIIQRIFTPDNNPEAVIDNKSIAFAKKIESYVYKKSGSLEEYKNLIENKISSREPCNERGLKRQLDVTNTSNKRRALENGSFNDKKLNAEIST